MNIRCPSCNGVRKVMGLGMIRKDCPICLGTGVIKQETSDELSAKLIDEKPVSADKDVPAKVKRQKKGITHGKGTDKTEIITEEKTAHDVCNVS